MNELFSAKGYSKPVILCIGTVNVLGDSLGPRVGDLLVEAHDVDAYVYGRTARPVNGINYPRYVEHIKIHHPRSIVIAVDACLGEKKDVGRVKYTMRGLRAGAALNRNLSAFGDMGILAVVAEKSDDNLAALVNADEEFLALMVKKTAEKVCSVIEDLRLNYNLVRNIRSTYSHKI